MSSYEEASLLPLIAAMFYIDWSHILVCHSLLNSSELFSMYNKAKFDLVLAPCFDYCTLFFAHEIGVPLVWHCAISTVLESVGETMGVPALPSYVPNALAYNGDRMNFGQRSWNTFLHWFNLGSYWTLYFLQKRVYPQHFPGDDKPGLSELMANVRFSTYPHKLYILQKNALPKIGF